MSDAERIVTLASMTVPAMPSSESTGTQPEMAGPEKQMLLARYSQILQRLRQETANVDPEVFITLQDREVSLAQSKLFEDGVVSRPLTSGAQELKFATGVKGLDWFGWAGSLFDFVDQYAKHTLVRPTTASATPIANDARIALAADWGTGLYGAPKIADAIRRMSEQQRFSLTMHLGDVYYSGTVAETQARFLGKWPRDAADTNRALNGNHEMYSGGYGYFDLILPEFQQESSYFAFKNDHWLLVGLDTAFDDHAIDNEQVAWLNTINEEAAKDGKKRKLILFSHHQPFSRLDHQGPKLQQALQHLLESNRVAAWYWGHEHQCVIYDPHPEWGMLGRCLGNGGIPEPRKSSVMNAPVQAEAGLYAWRTLDATAECPSCIVLDGPNMAMEKKSHQEKFGPHGFMTLELREAELIERVHLCDGTELWFNRIT